MKKLSYLTILTALIALLLLQGCENSSELSLLGSTAQDSRLAKSVTTGEAMGAVKSSSDEDPILEGLREASEDLDDAIEELDEVLAALHPPNPIFPPNPTRVLAEIRLIKAKANEVISKADQIGDLVRGGEPPRN